MFHVGADYHHIYFRDVYVRVISANEQTDKWIVKFEWRKRSNDEVIKYNNPSFDIQKADLTKWRYGKSGLI